MRSRSMPSKAQLRRHGPHAQGACPSGWSYLPISSRRPLSARQRTVACTYTATVTADILPAAVVRDNMHTLAAHTTTWLLTHTCHTLAQWVEHQGC